mmetsp:Transcript_9457/g.13032  ORF Transcript_9457/g.13032 Transcript_9457/m.13032 type:complete len:87 (-) Transcript_9457:216-476(-)
MLPSGSAWTASNAQFAKTKVRKNSYYFAKCVIVGFISFALSHLCQKSHQVAGFVLIALNVSVVDQRNQAGDNGSRITHYVVPVTQQ